MNGHKITLLEPLASPTLRVQYIRIRGPIGQIFTLYFALWELGRLRCGYPKAVTDPLAASRNLQVGRLSDIALISCVKHQSELCFIHSHFG
jgi:hypothetical protein